MKLDQIRENESEEVEDRIPTFAKPSISFANLSSLKAMGPDDVDHGSDPIGAVVMWC